MTHDSEHFYAVQSFLEDDELAKYGTLLKLRWREKVMTFKTQNFQ